MSVIIKDMSLPLPGDVIVCALIDNKLQCSIVTRGKPIEWCEALEIPTPHGRLIDADELKKNMRNYYPSIDHLCCSQHVVTKRDIDCAPTIIEAEVSE